MKTTLLQSDYGRGSVRDLARHLLPKNAAWKTVDFLPNYGAPLRKRGGYGDASPALSGAASTGVVAYAPFSSGPQLVAVDDRGHVFKVTSPSSATDMTTGAVNTASLQLQRPVFFEDLLIMPNQDGATAPGKYDGSANPDFLGGSAPTGKYAEAYKSRLLLAGSAADPNNIWFSDVLDPESWDTANSFIPVTQPIKGITALRNAILIFSDGMTERIRGDSPPPGGDMILEPAFQEGCVDARSIVSLGERVVWANGNGVWISDGAAADNLIELGGLLQYWVTLLEGYDPATWTVSAGTIHGYYIVTITDGTTFVEGLMCHLQSRTWSFLSNIKATMFAEAYGTTPELYFSMGGRPRIGKLGQIFEPDSTNQSDADGTDVEPYIETVFYRGTPASRRFKDIIVGNHMEVDSGSSTHLEVSVITSPEDTSYATLCEDDGVTPLEIAATGAKARSKVAARLASDGIGLKIAQSGPSHETMLFDIEATQHEREGLR